MQLVHASQNYIARGIRPEEPCNDPASQVGLLACLLVGLPSAPVGVGTLQSPASQVGLLVDGWCLLGPQNAV